MSNGSPGLHSNKGFSIGNEEMANNEVYPVNSERTDPLAHLLQPCSEETPLILPLPENKPKTDGLEGHHLVVDVFSISETDNSWRQASRFARYEEDCEGFDNHFGKPHVPFISMATYHALQQVTSKSILVPNVEYSGLDDLCKTLEGTIEDSDVPSLGKTIVKLIHARVHALEKVKPLSKIHCSSTQSLDHSTSQPGGSSPGGLPRSLLSAPNNLASLAVTQPKKLPPAVSGLRFKGSFLGHHKDSTHPLEPRVWDETNEVSMLVTGAVPGIDVCRLVVIRFTEPIEMGEIFPNMKKIRHLFFLIGPQLDEMQYSDMGRALATVVSNPNFAEIFEKLKSPESINRAIERFLADTVVIAPGRIDNKNLVAGDLIRKLVNMQAEKSANANTTKHVHPGSIDIEKNAPKNKDKDEKPDRCWLYSGVVDDLKNRYKHYWTDWIDGAKWSMITVVIYMFCVTVVPTLTFGAILSYGTQGILAVKECLIAQAICGAVWSFLSCQPLLIMSPTGPFLVFEKALYQFTASHNLDFLEVRLYTGMFLLIIAIFGSAFNIARLIRYVTIYTEDIFCALISLIFFFEVYEFLEQQLHHHPIQDLGYYMSHANGSISDVAHGMSEPNTFLLEVIMVVASIAIFHYLRELSRSRLLGRPFRNFLGNFGGSFAVVLITASYHLLFKRVNVSMVNIPEDFGNARNYGLFVIPRTLPSAQTLIVSALAAPLLFVLLFVETEIPQQMALRESRKLKKGGGLHWDLIVAGICTLVCSVLGLPWQCPAAVQSLAHITALTVYKKSAPGEPSRAAQVIEQRVSGLATYAALGVFSVVGHYLAMPSAAIFGVFFYLGIRNLNGNLLLMRMKLWLLPAKYRGNHKFLDIAPFYVTAFYTFIQAVIVALMFLAKSTQIGGLCFPLMLVACSVFVDKFLPLIFTKDLLEALDSEEEETDDDNEENPVDFYYNTRIPV